MIACDAQPDLLEIWRCSYTIGGPDLDNKAWEEHVTFGFCLRLSQPFFFCHDRLERNLRRKSGGF